MSQKFKRITNAKLHLHRQGGKNSGRDGITQVAETLFSLWSLIKEMHTETRAQNMESGGVVTYYNYLRKKELYDHSLYSCVVIVVCNLTFACCGRG